MSSRHFSSGHKRVIAAAVIGAVIWTLLPVFPGRTQQEQTKLYLGGGVMASVLPSRLLTKNAHVDSYLCSPTGLQVAYISKDDRDGVTYTSLAVQDISGGPSHFFRSWAAADEYSKEYETPAGFTAGQVSGFAGWSPNGQYLLFAADDQATVGEGDATNSYYCLDTRSSRIWKVDAPLLSVAWSPDCTRFAYIVVKRQPQEAAPVDTPLPTEQPAAPQPDIHHTTTQAWYYDLATGRTHMMVEGVYTNDWQRLTPSSGFRIMAVGWVDSHTCAFRQYVGQRKSFWTAYDAVNDKLGAPLNTNVKLVTESNQFSPLSSGIVAALPNGSFVGLYDTPMDPKDVSGNSRFSSLYMQFLKNPDDYEHYMDNNGGYMVDKRSTLLDVVAGGEAVFVPTGGFSGGIYHAIYNSWGDLRIIDIALRQASATEKYAAGEKLAPEEEREIAMTDAKEIGLGILQYCQDYDDRFPLPDNFHDEVYPYEKDEEPFKALGKYPFVYQPPDDLNMESIAVPASTIVGYIQLSDGRVVLYGDGHTKFLAN